ncbi:MAG: right-handed parallel beta-helix repeat-containing protein [Phycisphaerae bacterium]
MQRNSIFMVCVLCFATGGGFLRRAGATEYIVDPGGGGTHTTIQSAINTAVDGDSILVMPGVYVENIHFDGKAIDLHSADPLDPTTVASTIVDGSEDGHVVTFAGAEPAAAMLDGFTIRNGSAEHGGGVYCVNGSSPTIRHNRITNNFCVLHGAGIHCSDGASPLISDNEIFANIADGRGGGVFCQASGARIERNVIHTNDAPGSSGGAVHLHDGTDAVVVVDNVMTGNRAVFGAGIDIEFASPHVARNYIVGNFAAPRGAGISIVSGGPTVVDNIVAGNLANVAAAVDCNDCTALIRNNTFIANWAAASSVILMINGANVSFTGNVVAFSPGGVALKALTGSSAVVEANCFFGNVDGDFGGNITPGNDNIFVDPSIVQLGTWVENKDPGGQPPLQDLIAILVGTGAINGEARYKLEVDRERFRVRVFQGPPFATFDIRVANVVVGQLTLDGTGDADVEFDTNDGNFPPNFPEVDVGDAVNVGGVLAGFFSPNGFGGILPVFDWVPGDEHLQPGSPCIDGVTSATTPPGETDFDGQVRHAGASVDIGADEFIPSGTGDFDGDGDLDLADVAALQRCMTAPGDPAIPVRCTPGDFNADAAVDLIDFASFQAALTGP